MKYLAVAIRTAYLTYVLWEIYTGMINAAVFHGVVWIATLPILLFARWRKGLYVGDTLIVGLFLLSTMASQLGFALESSILGIDKLFHAVGGGILAYVFWQALDPLVKTNKWIFAGLVTACVLSIGAAWEVFEYIYFATYSTINVSVKTYVDTMLDLVADTLGAVLIVLIQGVRQK